MAQLSDGEHGGFPYPVPKMHPISMREPVLLQLANSETCWGAGREQESGAEKRSNSGICYNTVARNEQTTHGRVPLERNHHPGRVLLSAALEAVELSHLGGTISVATPPALCIRGAGITSTGALGHGLMNFTIDRFSTDNG